MWRKKNTAYSSIDGVLFTKDKKELVYFPSGKSGSYSIPDSVTTIRENAFFSCTSLTSVTIPDSVTTIGWRAFGGCTSLTSITIPNSATEIGSSAFLSCTSLTSVTIPNGVTELGANAFGNCASLTQVAIPDSVTTIRNSAFWGNFYLTIYYAGTEEAWQSISMSTDDRDFLTPKVSFLSFLQSDFIFDVATGTITDYIGSEAEVVIPEEIYGVKVTEIGYHAFSYRTSLTSVTIPDSVTTIGWMAFEGCTSLTNVTIPDSVTTIQSEAFFNCTSLTEIKVSESNKSYTSVDGVLFSKDKKTLISYPAGKKANSYTVPSSVTVIREYTFSNCTSLTNVIIPASVTRIGDFGANETGTAFYFDPAFFGCSSLNTVFYSGTEEDWQAIEMVADDWEFLTPKVVFVSSNPADYQFGETAGTVTKYTGSSANVMIPSEINGVKVTAIGDSAFQDCASLSMLVLPDSITAIGSNAFSGCTSLTNVVIPLNVAKIGENAFTGCDALSEIHYAGTEAEWKVIQMPENVRSFLASKVVFATVGTQSFVWGDVDGDERVTSKDKVLTSRYLAKWVMSDNFNKVAADFNNDGNISSAESVVLARYLAKWTNLPYPIGVKAS